MESRSQPVLLIISCVPVSKPPAVEDSFPKVIHSRVSRPFTRPGGTRATSYEGLTALVDYRRGISSRFVIIGVLAIMFEKGPTVSTERKEKRHPHPHPLEPLSDPDGRYFITSTAFEFPFNRTKPQPLGLRGGDFNLSRCIMKYIYRYGHFQFLFNCLSIPGLLTDPPTDPGFLVSVSTPSLYLPGEPPSSASHKERNQILHVSITAGNGTQKRQDIAAFFPFVVPRMCLLTPFLTRGNSSTSYPPPPGKVTGPLATELTPSPYVTDPGFELHSDPSFVLPPKDPSFVLPPFVARL
ncbi:hypothetical protein V6N12_076129 [Hibiscus sabdariffa]|uniref:Uncharacterized protein n=1 Tax=Hibiscus sabdariffa TaxID=183260 RepID=A0ABR2AYH0_9ROSI